MLQNPDFLAKQPAVVERNGDKLRVAFLAEGEAKLLLRGVFGVRSKTRFFVRGRVRGAQRDL